MTKTNRRPEITDDRSTRIISAPGGTWQVQRWQGQPNTREVCGAWRSAGCPLSYEDARASVGFRLTEVGTGPRYKRRTPRRLARFLARQRR